MKAFRFRLQTLLKVREMREQERQREHAAALNHVLLQREQVSKIDDRRKELIQETRALGEGAIPIGHLLMANRYQQKLKRDRLHSGEVLRGLEKQTEERRVELVKASTEKKIYEKLRERQKAQFVQRFVDLEKKENDEIGLQATRSKATD